MTLELVPIQMYFVRNRVTGAYFGDTDPLSKAAFKVAHDQGFKSYKPLFEYIREKSGLLSKIIGPQDRAVAMSHGAARVMIGNNPHLEMILR